MDAATELVLIVDDNPQNLQYLGNLLTANGYKLGFAQTGTRALEFVQNQMPDLILLDIMMPGTDGYQVCEQLQQTPATKDIPIIFITAKTDEDSIEKAYDAGGRDYVTKPFKPKELLARVKTHLQLKRVLNHLEFISSHDPMTGVFNRRKFFELATHLFSTHKQPLYAVMMDIDKFKSINDAYGHPFGDTIIISVAKNIHKHLGHSVIFGRMGGEEFAALGEFDTHDACRQTMETIRQKIQNLQFTTDSDESVHCSISSGIAVKTQSTPCIDTLLKNADDMLYEAKNTGRNRVAFRTSPHTP